MLPLLLAQQSPGPAPAGTAQWLEIAFYVMGCGSFVLYVVRQFKAPQKEQREIVGDNITIKAAPKYVEKADLETLAGELRSLVKRLDQIHAHVSAMEGRILEAGEHRLREIRESIGTVANDLNNRVNDMLTRVGFVEGVVDSLNCGGKPKR